MRAGKTILSQIIEWIHPEQFRRCVQRYGGNRRIRNFPCWDQFLAMAFAQLTYRDSLADIEVCLRSRPDQLYHMDMAREDRAMDQYLEAKENMERGPSKASYD